MRRIRLKKQTVKFVSWSSYCVLYNCLDRHIRCFATHHQRDTKQWHSVHPFGCLLIPNYDTVNCCQCTCGIFQSGFGAGRQFHILRSHKCHISGQGGEAWWFWYQLMKLNWFLFIHSFSSTCPVQGCQLAGPFPSIIGRRQGFCVVLVFLTHHP